MKKVLENALAVAEQRDGRLIDKSPASDGLLAQRNREDRADGVFISCSHSVMHGRRMRSADIWRRDSVTGKRWR